jgi:hypothetical protein
MNGWRYEFVDELPIEVYEVLLEMVRDYARTQQIEQDAEL